MENFISNLYAVKFASGSAGAPIAAATDNDALLSFMAAVNFPTTLIGSTYKEVSLWKIGSYDPVKMVVRRCTPVLIKLGSEVKLPTDHKADEKARERAIKKFYKATGKGAK